MSYIERNLLNDETILFRTRMHWIIFANPMFWSVFAMFLYYQFTRSPFLVLPPLLIAMALWVQQLISYASSEFGVSNRRLMLKVGWLSRYTVDLLLQRVETIQVEQGLIGRLFNYGTIIVIGTGSTHDRFACIASPFDFRRAVEEQAAKLLAPQNDK